MALAVVDYWPSSSKRLQQTVCPDPRDLLVSVEESKGVDERVGLNARGNSGDPGCYADISRQVKDLAVSLCQGFHTGNLVLIQTAD